MGPERLGVGMELEPLQGLELELLRQVELELLQQVGDNYVSASFEEPCAWGWWSWRNPQNPKLENLKCSVDWDFNCFQICLVSPGLRETGVLWSQEEVG